jgi:hypothetical protein
LEVDDEAYPSTQIHRRNQRKAPQIMKSKIEAKTPLKNIKMKNGAAHRETKIPPKCHGFKFKPHQVNDSTQSNKGIDHLVS